MQPGKERWHEISQSSTVFETTENKENTKTGKIYLICTHFVAYSLPKTTKTMQTPGRFQTTSHLLSWIPLSCVDIVSKVYCFVSFSPKELSQLIAFSPKSTMANYRNRRQRSLSSAHSNRFPTISEKMKPGKNREHTLL